MNFSMFSNEFFDPSTCYKDKGNWMGRVSMEGFAIYSYLLAKQGNNEYAEVSLKMIQSFFKKKPKKEYKLIYSESRHSSISMIKDKRTIVKYLDYLNSMKMIEYHDMEFAKEARINDIIYIRVSKVDPNNGSFEMVNNAIFQNHFHQIGHIGWALYCTLSRLHNSTFGSISSIGFACPTQEYLMSVLHVRACTISAYANLLQEVGLIKIEVSKPKFSHYDVNGNEIFEYTPNSYIVVAKDPENKYYIK